MPDISNLNKVDKSNYATFVKFAKNKASAFYESSSSPKENKVQVSKN